MPKNKPQETVVPEAPANAPVANNEQKPSYNGSIVIPIVDGMIQMEKVRCEPEGLNYSEVMDVCTKVSRNIETEAKKRMLEFLKKVPKNP